MRSKRHISVVFCSLLLLGLLLLSACSGNGAPGKDTPADNQPVQSKNTGTAESSDAANHTTGGNAVNEIAYKTPDGETGYVYIPDAVQKNLAAKVPMVLMMCCTGGEARSNAKACGWVEKAAAENIIVLAPNYNNYATYGDLEGIVSAVRYAIETYPVDVSRVYATGFSNGGAVSVALTSEYPELFAAISAYGWMVDMRQSKSTYDMPFQVIQGTNEYTYATTSGAMAIMTDEQEAIRSLFLFNEMLGQSEQPNYDKTPYWGYTPDEVHSAVPDGRKWTFNNYFKAGFTAPFAQFVLIDGARHVPHEHDATVAWDFFQHFSRAKNGSIQENK